LRSWTFDDPVHNRLAGQNPTRVVAPFEEEEEVHNRLPLEDVLSHINPAHNFTDCWTNIIVALHWF